MLSKAAATAWGPVTRAGSLALTVADHVPAGLVKAATSVGRAVLAISPSAPAGFTSYLRDRGLHVRAGAHAAAKDAA